MLGADEVMMETSGFFAGPFQGLFGPRREIFEVAHIQGGVLALPFGIAPCPYAENGQRNRQYSRAQTRIECKKNARARDNQPRKGDAKTRFRYSLPSPLLAFSPGELAL